MKGLQTLSVLDALKAYPEQFHDVFTSENIASLHAQTVDLVYQIDYVEQGSHARQKQEMAIVFWRDYLQDCESKHPNHAQPRVTFTTSTPCCI